MVHQPTDHQIQTKPVEPAYDHCSPPQTNIDVERRGGAFKRSIETERDVAPAISLCHLESAPEFCHLGRVMGIGEHASR